MEQAVRRPDWQAWFSTASEQPGQLASGLLADFEELLPSSRKATSNLPDGQAPRMLLRSAANEMLERQSGRSKTDQFRIALATSMLTALPRSDYVLAGSDEVHRHSTQVAAAHRVATGARDPLLMAIVGIQEAHSMLESLDLARRDFRRVVDICRAADRWIEKLKEAPDLGLVHEACSNVDWLPSPREAALRLRLTRHRLAASAWRMQGLINPAWEERSLQLATAMELGDAEAIADAYGKRSHLARRLGEVEISEEALELQRGLIADEGGGHHLKAILNRSHAARARSIQDWDADWRHNHLFLKELLAAEGVAIGRVTPPAADAALEALFRENRRRAVDQVGRVAHDLARTLLDSGVVEVDADQWQEATDWARVALAAWTHTESASVVAAHYQQLCLRALDLRRVGAHEGYSQIATGLVRCARSWRRPWGPPRALRRAAEYCEPSNADTLNEIDAQLRSASHPDYEALLCAKAAWSLRAASVDRHTTGKIRLLWKAIDHSDRALQSLGDVSGPSSRLFSRAYVEALQLKVEALEQIRRLPVLGGFPSYSAKAELETRALALPGIAADMLMAGTAARKQLVDRRYQDWLGDTLAIAVAESDHHRVDQVCEVLRRDFAANLLLEMSKKGKAATPLKGLIRTMGWAVTDQADDRTISDLHTRIEGTIGQLARELFDPSRVGTVSTEEVLQSSGLDGILSLLTLGDRRAVVHLHIAGRPAIHHLEIVDLPHAVSELVPGDREHAFNQRLVDVARCIIPQPLIDELTSRPFDEPFKLLVIPSGLFGIPFASLVIGDDFLIDRCEVQTMESLSAARALATAPRRPCHAGLALGVYDERLPGAFRESLELNQSFDVLRADCADQVRRSLDRDRPELIAMGVHGEGHDDSWRHTKTMPDDSILTTDDVIQWRVPPVVILGSCHSSIGQGKQGGVAGFPVALQLRGAKSVVGTIRSDLNDHAAAEILGHFYVEMRGGSKPARALRAAQRLWLEEDAHRAGPRSRWANLVIYGVQ